jgi:uncharacterized NAD-dependent epimerase/dehydratase family protein
MTDASPASPGASIDMDGTALVLTNGILHKPNAKTAHGLIRGSERFRVVGLIDHVYAGQDAGEALDGIHRDIPIFETLDAALAALPEPPDYIVIGIATHGGMMTDALRDHLYDALSRGISVVNGLHGFASHDPRLVRAARESGATITDVRNTPPRHELRFWHGAIYQVRAPRIAVLGTDCALGKRTTTRFLTQALAERNVHAEMIYTGQTGWMQGARYGFIFDSVPNDFVSGELEHAIVACDKEVNPDVILLEGQSSLRNPAGPAGAEFLVSGQARAVILQHACARTHFEGYEDLENALIPSIADECRVVELYGARVIGIAVNGEGLDRAGTIAACDTLRAELDIPAAAPLYDGMDVLVDAAIAYIEEERARRS